MYITSPGFTVAKGGISGLEANGSVISPADQVKAGLTANDCAGPVIHVSVNADIKWKLCTFCWSAGLFAHSFMHAS
jgi:hypothetical protein